MSKPPFRAEMVGSLLRAPRLKEARAKRLKGDISVAAFAEIEDREVEAVIRKQEESGFLLATDGELRRSSWHQDFLWHLNGVERVALDRGTTFSGVVTKPEGTFVSGKLDFPFDHPMLGHFRFLKSRAIAVPKLCIPSPSMLHFRRGRAGVSEDAYPDMAGFFIDLAKTYRKAVQAFYDAGCRYLQFDDTAWAHLCSDSQRRMARDRGETLDLLPAMYARVINYAVADRPADLVVTLHTCHGNFRSSWQSEGGYEPAAEYLFNELDCDGFFLEFDSPRAGGFEPLRFLPKGKMAVLGLVTTKTGAIESEDYLKVRIEEAARHADIDQLCLSPQCGFASTEEGNILAEHEQWTKLRLIVRVAEDTWRSR